MALISVLFLTRALPWWGDGGDWLKRVNAILGNSYPMWEQTTFQYPPVFMLLVAGLSQIVGEILALKLMAVIVYALVPLTTYFFVKELMHDRLAALAAAWLAGFTPIWVEMIGWGGYPDLLGLSLLPFAFYGILRYRSARSSLNLAILASGSFLIPVTHHLTSITFVGVLVLWGVLSLKFDRPALKPIAASLLFAGAAFGVNRVIAGPFQFLFFNSAALSYLQTGGATLLYMFKSWFLFGVLYAAALGAAVLMFVEKERRPQAILLVSWVVFPLVATQAYVFGFATDYNRILFFFAQPLMILAAVPFVYLSPVAARLRGVRNMKPPLDYIKMPSFERTKLGKQLLAVIVVALSLIAVVQTTAAGTSTITNVNNWYSSLNIDPYGDQQSLQAVNFIHQTTSPTAVIIAEYPIGRWIEGIAQRRVMLELDPRYLFITGEVQREESAKSILGSVHGIRNGYAWIMDQSPYGSYAPLVGMFLNGEYTNMVYVNDSLSTVTWVNTATGLNYTRSLTNSTQPVSSWVRNDPENATLSVTYNVGPITVVREESLTPNSADVGLSYRATTTDPSVEIKDLLISVGSWPGSGPASASLVGNRTLLEETSVGPLYIYSTSFTAFPFYFSPRNMSHGITGQITLWTGQPGNGTYLYSYDRSSLISGNRVTDIVVPNLGAVVVPVGATITIEKYIKTTDFYENLLRDPSFQVAYFNDDVIVLKVVQ